jgi:hypothetical protein
MERQQSANSGHSSAAGRTAHVDPNVLRPTVEVHGGRRPRLAFSSSACSSAFIPQSKLLPELFVALAIWLPDKILAKTWLDGFWIHRVLLSEGIESHVVVKTHADAD